MLGFFLPDPDNAVIWRGPLKMGLLKQFLKDVAWGDLDFLIIDSPPGTGDEPLSVCQLLGKVDGDVIGGFHLLHADDQRIESTLAELKILDPRFLVPCHCTGERPMQMLQATFGDRVRLGRSGAVFEF